MVGLSRRESAPSDCGCHHWHVTAHGWECCGCTTTHGRVDRPPVDDEAAECRRPDDHCDESIAAWLAEEDPDVCATDVT